MTTIGTGPVNSSEHISQPNQATIPVQGLLTISYLKLMSLLLHGAVSCYKWLSLWQFSSATLYLFAHIIIILSLFHESWERKKPRASGNNSCNMAWIQPAFINRHQTIFRHSTQLTRFTFWFGQTCQIWAFPIMKWLLSILVRWAAT